MSAEAFLNQHVSVKNPKMAEPTVQIPLSNGALKLTGIILLQRRILFLIFKSADEASVCTYNSEHQT